MVSSNRRDDYVVKRDEYEIAKIPSYWIVDPKKKLVRVFTKSRNKEGYTSVDFTEEKTIVSSQFVPTSVIGARTAESSYSGGIN